MSPAWCNKPDGHYHTNQVQFLRSTDEGRTWTMSPVDEGEWERIENTWAELDNGELICVMRSNYTTNLAISRSDDKGKTWSRCSHAIPYHGPSPPIMIRTRDNILVLAVRHNGIFTSLDRGYTWSDATYIGGYYGSGSGSAMVEMPDGRIMIVGDDDEKFLKAQFFSVDGHGVVHPQPPGPIS